VLISTQRRRIYRVAHISLENLGHFATTISTLLRRYVVDIVTNIESLKRHFMDMEISTELELTSQERRP
jgi:hypothetical protein